MTAVTLFGVPLDRPRLLDRIGDMSQVAAIEHVTLRGGRADGMDAIHCRTGALGFTVLPSRALDVSWAEYCGRPLCWRSPMGDVAPAYFEPADRGWLRSFAGGLLTTCGLASAGQPSRDAGEELGLHGRVSNLPAAAVHADAAWVGDEYRMSIKGRVRDGTALGPTLELRRRVETALGADWLRIEDEVENVSRHRAPHMFRYHVNLGFPLVDAGSRLHADVRTVAARDEASDAAIDRWNVITAPDPRASEQVFYLDLAPEADGTVEVALTNHRLGDGAAGLRLRYSSATLPRFLLWKLLTPGTYVIGLEPSTCTDGGRATERAAGTLVELAPGERRSYRLELQIVHATDLEATARRSLAAGRRAGAMNGDTA